MCDKEGVYRSNIQILYSDLQRAIADYIDHGHSAGEMKYINAYSMAVLGAVVAYYDTVKAPQSGSKQKNEGKEILACKYANNMLKHDPSIVTHVQSSGGLSFRMSFPFSIEEIKVVWKWQDFHSKHPEQKAAFQELFANKPVLDTLQQVLTHLGIDI